MKSVILLPTQPVRVWVAECRFGEHAKPLGRNHKSASFRRLAERLWIRRFLVRFQEGQSQAPPSPTSDGGVCVWRTRDAGRDHRRRFRRSAARHRFTWSMSASNAREACRRGG